jgi:hypothetical protein
MSPQQYTAHYGSCWNLGEGGMGDVYYATDKLLSDWTTLLNNREEAK